MRILDDELHDTLVRDQAFTDHPLRQIIETLLLVTLGPSHGWTIMECGMRPRLTIHLRYRSLDECFHILAEHAACTYHADRVERTLRFPVDDRGPDETMRFIQHFLAERNGVIRDS